MKLHLESQKATSHRSSAPIEWSDSLRSWCIFDPNLIIEILKSADFVVTQAERMEKRHSREVNLRRRYAQKLAATEASTSWRLTAPLRRLADVVRRLSRMMRAKQ